jgi:uncharacterized protein (DUF983 family)
MKHQLIITVRSFWPRNSGTDHRYDLTGPHYSGWRVMCCRCGNYRMFRGLDILLWLVEHSRYCEDHGYQD